ncbi:golgin candidate 5 [Magnolia sinica]|uniref:golgin candidate 5 n=1 Tax=Magnolia sinica TaxID=86752 RepID=UPI002658CF4A|nr:golgin candidate 5 [Magnolia sinica]
MAWLGKVSLGGFPDLAGAVTKLSESVKNIEKNFDNALGLEEKPESGEASGLWPSASDRKALFEPMMAFMGHKGGDSSVEHSEKAETSQSQSPVEEHDRISTEGLPPSASEQTAPAEKENEAPERREEDRHSHDSGSTSIVLREHGESEASSHPLPVETDVSVTGNLEIKNSDHLFQQKTVTEMEPSEESIPEESKPTNLSEAAVENIVLPMPAESHHMLEGKQDEHETEAEQVVEEGSPQNVDALYDKVSAQPETSDSSSVGIVTAESATELFSHSLPNTPSSGKTPDMASESAPHDIGSPIKSVEVDTPKNDFENDTREQRLSSGTHVSDSVDSTIEIEKVKMEMKMMEAALQGAARQAQSKADEIAKLMNENERLKSTIDDLKRNADSETDALREEYHQRVASLERKVYALTKERDTLRREQSRKSDAAALLKEKDEIINQVMAEGEELSRKQAAQESMMRKLRAQIRELEEEKQRLNSKLQVEETKVESIKRDKAATEKLLQETIERNQAELAAQKEFYTNALNAAKEAEALAEARANNEARTELESRLREAGEREATLVQALEELRQTLSRTEQQAVFREDMLQRDIDDLQKRYQASERRCEELITQLPESTRPLLRQIEAMQETTSRRAEAWAGVERALNSRLQEAEAKASAAEERERSMNERLSQTLSRMAVLEAQITCLRTEQTQLSRSLEKERQRASENRQEYLAVLEAAATHEGRAKQLEDEIKELRSKHKHELQQELTQRELLEEELERERTARSDLERAAHVESSVSANQPPTTKHTSPYIDNGNVSIRKLSSAGSLSSMDESFFLHASLDSSDGIFSERKVPGETALTPYFLNSMTPSAFEATLRQKDGELASYMSRLASLESIRDSLSEELVKMTAECEKLRAEVAMLPGLRAELEALRRRHTAALELMGERDEELEELRADIIDLKEMYREQVDLLVNKIQVMSSSGSSG